MTSIATKLINGVHKLRAPARPSMMDLHKLPHEVDRGPYAGPCADIFFANEGAPVHKWLHYLPIYDRVLGGYQGKPIRFLEIGVFKGGSLKMWRQFFGPQATIFGVDINPDCAAFDGDHGQVRIGSQDDHEFLRRVVAEMGGVDVVLDDGSHVASHQRVSFDVLFPLVSDDGLYLIEDMHTAYWSDYEGGLKRPGTAIEFLKDLVDDMHAHYRDGARNTAAALPPIESVQFFDSIAVVHKRRQEPRCHVMIPRPAEG